MMRRSHATTSGWWTGIPRWRTTYHKPDRPINWLLFRWFDWIPLALMLVVPWNDPLGWLCVAWYVVLLPVVVLHRMRVRHERVCLRSGHLPWRPEPGVVECRVCGETLDDEQLLRSKARQREFSQAQVSDRR